MLLRLNGREKPVRRSMAAGLVVVRQQDFHLEEGGLLLKGYMVLNSEPQYLRMAVLLVGL